MARAVTERPTLDRAAAEQVCRHAVDAAEARLFMIMLGMIEDPDRRDPPRDVTGRSRDRKPLGRPPKLNPLTGAELDWMQERGMLREVQE